jgi:hypothetical protein
MGHLRDGDGADCAALPTPVRWCDRA